MAGGRSLGGEPLPPPAVPNGCLPHSLPCVAPVIPSIRTLPSRRWASLPCPLQAAHLPLKSSSFGGLSTDCERSPR